MHLAEGILSVPVLVAGGVAATAGVAFGLRRTRDDEIPRVAVMSAGFFVASLIHVPIGFASVHLILNGLCGLILGWAAFPAILVGLLLQAVLFGFGGLTALGVNTVIMAVPAVACGLVFRPIVARARSEVSAALAGMLTGSIAIASSGVLAAIVMAASDRAFLPAASLMLGAHLPVMVAEAAITGAMVVFFRKVRPEILN